MELDDRKGNLSSSSSSSSCSICLDLVLDGGDRSIAKLQCGHEFHLDCIGSAFNVKGAMQCPNCRKVENGRWLFANGQRASADFDPDPWVTEDFYDLNYPEPGYSVRFNFRIGWYRVPGQLLDLPFGSEWCPYRGITLASLFEEGQSQLNSYHDAFGNSTFRNHLSASSSRHVCPHVAFRAFPHAIMHRAIMHNAPSPADSFSENSGAYSHNHVTNLGLGGGQPSASTILPNSHSNVPQNHNSVPFPFVSITANHHQSASQFGPRLASSSDGGSQQRVEVVSFGHPHSLSGSGHLNVCNTVASLNSPVHAPAYAGNHHHTASSSSSHGSTPIPPPPRMSRPQGAFTPLSSSLETTSYAEVDGFQSFTTPVSGSANRSTQDAENVAQHYDQFNGRGDRHGLTFLPWIPSEGESQRWSAFDPNQASQSGGISFLQRANTTEWVGQSQTENGGYERMPLPARMPPPPYL